MPYQETMDVSSSSSSSVTSSSSSFLTVSLRTSSKSSSSAAQTLYYYNVDAILSELIRPATPKQGNLARPRLVKPEPIRPQQLVGVMNHFTSGSSSSSHRRISSDKAAPSLMLLNDRTEGARNPDPTQQQQQLTTPFSMDDEEEDEDAGMTYGSDGVISTLDYYGHRRSAATGVSGCSKRSRDDEDILYYKKTGKSTVAAEEIDASVAAAAALATPNPIQYYSTSGSSQPATSASPTMFASYDEPQYIVYKNYSDHNVNDHHNGQMSDAHNNNNDNRNNYGHWTTTTPSTTVSYTIVKPVAMRPMDVIQHLHHDHFQYRMEEDMEVTTLLPPDTTAATTSCPSPKNLLHDVLDDGSMQVCG